MSEPKETGVNSKAFQNDDSFDPANFDDQDPLSLDAVDDEWEQLVVERDQLKDRLMRSLADAENTRKRLERDRRDAETYGGSKLARDMLPVYDNMQRALEAVDDNQREASKALIEGIELTLRELLNTFSKHKIERVSPEIGEKFDPQVHQAMFEAPVPGIDGGKVIQMLTDGFVIGDRLLRPAQVGVSSAPPKS